MIKLACALFSRTKERPPTCRTDGRAMRIYSNHLRVSGVRMLFRVSERFFVERSGLHRVIISFAPPGIIQLFPENQGDKRFRANSPEFLRQTRHSASASSKVSVSIFNPNRLLSRAMTRLLSKYLITRTSNTVPPKNW